MEKLGLYALHEDNNNYLFSFATGSSDSDMVKMYLEMFNSQYKTIKSDADKALFANGIHNCSIVRLGYINVESGIITDNELNALMLLRDFNFEVSENG